HRVLLVRARHLVGQNLRLLRHIELVFNGVESLGELFSRRRCPFCCRHCSLAFYQRSDEPRVPLIVSMSRRMLSSDSSGTGSEPFDTRWMPTKTTTAPMSRSTPPTMRADAQPGSTVARPRTAAATKTPRAKNRIDAA